MSSFQAFQSVRRAIDLAVVVDDHGMMAATRVHSSVVFDCGSISADAEVMWIRKGAIGINFKRPIADDQIREQISRYAALQAFRGQERRS